MTSDEGMLPGAGGPALHWVAVAPETPRAAVGLLHGYADYAHRYAHVMDAWAGRGIATVGLDLRGHGLSEGRRGYCDRFGDFLDDASRLERLVQERHPSLPAVFVGHSFGGLVAVCFLLDRPGPWRALLLSSPFFDVATPVPPVKVAAARLASRVFPTLALPSGLSGASVTHDAERARAYDADPLVFKTATARWFTETRAAQARALARAPSLGLPLLVVAGGADPVVSVPRERTFFDAAGSADKTWDERPGLLHETLNEVGWEPIAGRMADWILAQTAR